MSPFCVKLDWRIFQTFRWRHWSRREAFLSASSAVCFSTWLPESVGLVLGGSLSPYETLEPLCRLENVGWNFSFWRTVPFNNVPLHLQCFWILTKTESKNLAGISALTTEPIVQSSFTSLPVAHTWAFGHFKPHIQYEAWLHSLQKKKFKKML